MYDWTLKAVKLRGSLDKQDKRDIAQAVFAQDRDGRLISRINDLRALTFEREGEDEGTAAENAVNLELARAALMDEWLEDKDSNFTIKDRPVVAMGVAMTLTEYDILTTLLRVYDLARSHFVFEICEESVRRFLNATRIRFEEDGDRMPWLVYRATILERMQNSSIIDGLLSYVITSSLAKTASQSVYGWLRGQLRDGFSTMMALKCPRTPDLSSFLLS